MSKSERKNTSEGTHWFRYFAFSILQESQQHSFAQRVCPLPAAESAGTLGITVNELWPHGMSSQPCSAALAVGMFTQCSPWCSSISQWPLFIRTPVILEQGAPSWPYFNLNASRKTPSPKGVTFGRTRGLGLQQMTLGGTQFHPQQESFHPFI